MHSHTESILPSVVLSVQLLLEWLKVSYNYHRIIQRQDSFYMPPNAPKMPLFEMARFYQGAHEERMRSVALHPKPSGLSERPLPLSSGLLVQRMRQHGWCPHRVLNTCTSLSRITLYYLSSLRRTTTARVSHERCTVAGCFAALQKPNSSHRSPNCTCSQIPPDRVHIKRLLKSGKIPLMQVTKKQSGQLNLRIVEAAPYTRYTAISHIVRLHHSSIPFPIYIYGHKRAQLLHW